MVDKPVPAVPDRLAKLKTEPYPPAYALALVPDAKLKAALDAAVAAGPGAGWRVALTLVEVTTGRPLAVAGLRETEVHFSASLLKVAAMYAAYELRKHANALAVELGKTKPKAAMIDLAAAFDPKIVARAASIPALKGVQKAHCCPRYSILFTAVQQADGTCKFELTKGAMTAIDRMIHISSNGHAAQCVQNAGYGYMNGALAAGGFFDPAKNSGVWLAGDYTGTYPYFRIDSVNDQAVAQATTTRDLAKLYTLLARRELVDDVSSDAMLAELAKPATGNPVEVFIHRADGFAIDFTVTHTKVGLAQLKPKNGGQDVLSEGSILRHEPSKRRFVAVWQNALWDDLNPLIKVVNDTLAAFTK